MKKQKPQLVNCDFCGRDTRNKSRICVNCTGGHNEAFVSREVLERREIESWVMGEEITRDDEIQKDVERSVEID